MTQTEAELGPVDYLVVEYPDGKPTGEALPYLLDLVDKGTIRILDVALIAAGEDGSATVVQPDASGDSGFAVFDGAATGMLSEEDLADAAAILTPARSGQSWSTRTPGPHRSRLPCAGLVPAWWPMAVYLSTHCWQPSMLKRRTPDARIVARVARTAVIAGTATAVSNNVPAPAGTLATQGRGGAGAVRARAAIRSRAAVRPCAGCGSRRQHGRQDQAAEGTPGAQGARHPHRRGVRRAEGQVAGLRPTPQQKGPDRRFGQGPSALELRIAPARP